MQSTEIIFIIIMLLVSGVTFYIERRRISYVFIILFSFWLLEETQGIIIWSTIILLSLVLANLSKGILAFSVKPITVFEKLTYVICIISSLYMGFNAGSSSIPVTFIVSIFVGFIVGFFIIDLLNAYLITWITYLFGKEIIYKKVKLQFSMYISEGKYRYKVYRVKSNQIDGEFSPSRRLLKRYAGVILKDKESYANVTVKSVKVKVLPVLKKMMIVEIV